MHYRRPCNSSKNRYVDVTCLEHSRVLLRVHQQSTANTLNTGSASTASGKVAARADKQVPIYIHANWVDSYRQRNAFICTQGEFEDVLIFTFFSLPSHCHIMIGFWYDARYCFFFLLVMRSYNHPKGLLWRRFFNY